MTEVLHMDWPFAVVLVAAIIGLVVVYGMRKALEEEKRRVQRTQDDD